MTLATVGPDLRPSTRIVLVKGYDERGIVWFTNYDSRKGRQLAGNPFAALQFHWVEPGARGAYRRHRGKSGRRRKRRILQEPPARLAHRRLGQPAKPGDPRARRAGGQRGQVRRAVFAQPAAPPHWGGYRLKPEQWEFWQGRKSRLHDRLRYRAEGDQWVRERLAP